MKTSWQVLLGIGLIAASALVYLLHYMLFRDAHHIFLYLVGDIGFVFVEVLLVSLVIHRILERREQRSRLEKLNMVIGAFFSEVGTELLRRLAAMDPQADALQERLAGAGTSAEDQYRLVSDWLERHDFAVRPEPASWAELDRFLAGKRGFLLRLLENQSLLEHESFTDTLWAVTHLTEELAARRGFGTPPAPDHHHLTGDLVRVYTRLARQWRQYMGHLQANYAYLFSLAVRINPLRRDASPVVSAPPT